MNIGTTRNGIGFLLLVSLSTGNAFVRPPELVPEQPVEGDIVSIVVSAGHCDQIFPDQMDVTQEGQTIRVVLHGLQSTLVCILPELKTVFEIGSLAAGSWTLQVDYSHYSPGDPGNVTVETIGIINFAVAPASVGVVATPVPAFGVIGTIILGLILLAVASLGLRRRAGRPA